MSEHHASCRPGDRELIWYCGQCGIREPYDDEAGRTAALREFIEALVEARWHNFPVSVKEFQAFADEYLRRPTP